MKTWHQAITELELGLIDKALRKTRGSVVSAAELLEIPRSTLYRRMKTYRIDADFYLRSGERRKGSKIPKKKSKRKKKKARRR